MGIPGGQVSCKLPSPWVTWLSLGLHITGKHEVCGQSHVGCPKKQRRLIPELLVGAVSGKGVPGLQVVGGILSGTSLSWLGFSTTALSLPTQGVPRWKEQLILSSCGAHLPSGAPPQMPPC